MKSLRTTIAGAMAAVGLLLTQTSYTVDEDATTSTDWSKVGGAALSVLGIFGLGWFSKQEDPK